MQDENSPIQKDTKSVPAFYGPEHWVEEHGDYLFDYGLAPLS